MDLISFLGIVRMILLMLTLLTLAIILLMLAIVHNKNSEEFIKEKIERLVKEAGGTNTETKRVSRFAKGAYYFSVNYNDREGNQQTVKVTQRLNFWGRFDGDIFWSEPLHTSSPPALVDDLDRPKEQLISEMDAEIRRLRSALAAVGADGLSKRVQGDTK